MEATAAPAHGTPAPYGRACSNCSRAKCRCIMRSGGNSCERCYRLDKECRPSDTLRNRGVKRKTVPKTAQLVEKLDDLVKLLSSSNQTSLSLADQINNSVIPTEMRDGHSTVSQQLNTTTPSNRPAESPIASGSSLGTSASPASDVETPSLSAVSSTCEPTLVEAEAFLDTFRSENLKYLPFLYIPPTTLSQQLRQERPFLWLCIMGALSKSGIQQVELGNRIRATLAQALIFKHERNFDMLLGLLALLAWYNCPQSPKPFLTLYIQLAVCLVYDLGLNRPPPPEPNPFVACRPGQSAPRTMEERRAILGCYLVTSAISTFLQKGDPLRWTPYMEECLHILSEAKESPSDEVLVLQVKFQLVVEEAARISGRGAEAGIVDPSKAPLFLYLKALHLQLAEAKRSIPISLQQHDAVTFYHHMATFTINELALHKGPTAPDIQRLNALWACVHSTKSWFEFFCTIPLTKYTSLPFSIFAQLSPCITTLYRLSTLDDPTWDKEAVRETADLLQILDVIAERLAQVPAAAGLERDAEVENSFAKVVKIIKSLRANWETTLAADTGSARSSATTAQSSEAVMPEGIMMDFSNEPLFIDMFESWDY